MARRAGFIIPKAEKILSASLAVGSICVPLAVGTVASMASGTIQFWVKVAFLGPAIAVAG